MDDDQEITRLEQLIDHLCRVTQGRERVDVRTVIMALIARDGLLTLVAFALTALAVGFIGYQVMS
ncbi:hypothetical protein ACPF7Z_02630 [Halomonas sp. GXIMD04776]|uniref:hypothetical protein n=1 Tax=Halomonas sp. GXIMD04776 TaxID=3415605 RepID=UPI003CBC6CA3